MKILYSFLLLAVVILLDSCSCAACNDKGEFYMVPDSIRVEADKFVISKTGRDFFDKYIHFNYEESKQVPDGYFIYYNYTDLQREYINEKIFFVTDTTGNVLKKFEVTGIPEVKKHPEHCEFSLNEQEARKVAMSENFPDGVNDWQVSFRWSAEFDRYIWHILNVEWEGGSPENYKGKGEELIISPVDGTVITRRIWNIR